MPYVHPDDSNLENLHKSMGYDSTGAPAVRAGLSWIEIK